MRKVLGVLLAVCMLCGLMPLTAFAASNLYDVTVEGADYTVVNGTVGPDAFDDANSSLELELKSKTGVIFSEMVSVTVGGEEYSDYHSYYLNYDASDDTVTLYVYIGNGSGVYIDGDIVITLSEESAPRVETLFPTATVVTETTQFEDAYTGETYYVAVDGSSMQTAYDAKAYAVELEQDQEIWVSSYSNEDTMGDTWVLVYGEDGDGYESVAYFDDDSKNGLQESFIFTAPADGKYYFVFSHYGSAEGEYVNAFSYEIPEDMTPYLDAATPLADTVVSCDKVENYMLEGAIYSVLAAFKTDKQQDFLLGTEDEDAGVSYMVLYKDPLNGYMAAMGGDVVGGTKELLTLGAEEILLLVQNGKEPYDVSIKLMADAVADVLDFTASPAPTPSENDKWAWDADKKELTLKDGFNMQVGTVNSDEGAILLPDGATVIIDGEIYAASSGYVLNGVGALTVKGKTGRSDALRMDASSFAVMAGKDLLVENCTVSGEGGFGSYTNVTVDNVKTSIVGIAIAAAIGNTPDEEACVVIKNSDVTFGGAFLALSTEKTTVENCISHVFTGIDMNAAGGMIAPIEVNGGAMTWSAYGGMFDLDLVQIGEDTEFFLVAMDGFAVADKENLPAAEKVEFFDEAVESMCVGGYDDMLVYDDAEDVYYFAAEDGTAVFAIGTPYFADMANAKVTADKKEYAHDATIKVDATALTPAVGVHGNTRLLPVSWKIGDKEGTFEDGKYTIELNAADLGAGEHTVVVTYAYDKMNVDTVNNFAVAPLLKSIWEAAEADFDLTASVTFRVLGASTGGGAPGVPAPIVPAPTGDAVDTLPLVLLTVASALGLAVLTVTKKRKA